MKTDVLTIMRIAGLPEPEREYQFSDKRRWRFDFAWPENKLAVEIEGGIFTGGRHVRGRGYDGDCQKYNEAQLLGWVVLRFTSLMINDGRALTQLQRAASCRLKD